MADYKTLLSTIDAGICTITLNRPDSYNAFNEELTTELQDALKQAESNADVRCVVLTGAGKAFSSGQDLKDAPTPGGKRSLADSLKRRYNPIIRRIRSMPKPVIASLNGVVAGAGCGVAFACDYRIAADHVKFVEAFINIALVPDSGALYTVFKSLGYAKAFEWATLGDPILAKQAEHVGLINRVVSADDLAKETRLVAERYAKGPTRTYGLVKRMLVKAEARSLDQTLDHEVWMQELAGRGADYGEGVKAFIEKRPPDFTGS